MPGQGKRKRRQEAERRRLAARTSPDAGRWEVVVDTQDGAELRAHVRRLAEEGLDESMIRVDMPCSRPVRPTTYRLSRFVADPAREGGLEP